MNYIDILPEIIEKYNNTYHRSIKCTPTVAREPSSYQNVFKALYGNVQPINTPKYKVGDRVRIRKKRSRKDLHHRGLKICSPSAT